MLEIILRMDISQSSSHKRCSMLLAPQSISYTPSLCVQLSLQPKAFPFKLLKEPQRWHFPSVKKEEEEEEAGNELPHSKQPWTTSKLSCSA